MKKSLPALIFWCGIFSTLIGLCLLSGQIQIPASQYAIPSEVYKAMAVPDIDSLMILGKFREAESLKGKIDRDGAFRVRVNRQGGFIVEIGKEAYIFETRLSYPGPKLAWTSLGFGQLGSEGRVPAVIEKEKNGDVLIRIETRHYGIQRRLHLEGGRLRVSDMISNVQSEAAGIIYAVDLAVPGKTSPFLLGGAGRSEIRMTSENPSLFVSQAKSRLGWIAEDAVFRLQLAMKSSATSARMFVERFGLPTGQSHTFQWAVYPLAESGDYWTFVNSVRRDWGVNWQVVGPYDSIDLLQKMDFVRDRDRLKAYLVRKKIKVISFAPWVDYDNYHPGLGRNLTRPEMKALLREAMAAYKRIDPDILCLGSMEGNFVSPPLALQKYLWDSAPGRPKGQYPLSDEQMIQLKKFNVPWQDCLLQNPDGRYRYEVYFRGPKDGLPLPQISLAVFAATGNRQHLYWLDQAKFLIEDVGLDGLYIDQFSLAFNDHQRYSYQGWDGVTVDIDPRAGTVLRKYIDAAYVGIGARRGLADYVVGKGKFMMANTFPATREMQSVPIHRFNESEWDIDPLAVKEGRIPPLAAYPCKGHFSTPVALGFRPRRYGPGYEENYAKVIMKGAISYLRHGILYYHYQTEIPESGSGAGDYGAINHMFPITVQEIHAGWVAGKERIVTCVSGIFTWKGSRKPEVSAYDLIGHPVEVQAEFMAESGAWTVRLKLRDWAEIAVISRDAET